MADLVKAVPVKEPEPAPAPTPAPGAAVKVPVPNLDDAQSDIAVVSNKSTEDPTGATVPVAELDTVGTAKVAGPLDPDMPASHHMAQKFGNDPANPQPAKHVQEDYNGPMVRLNRITPDKSQPALIDVHPDMVGDYLRAGWSK